MKKVLCILLVFLLTGALLTGCGKEADLTAVEMPLDEAAAKAQIEAALQNKMTSLQKDFDLADARLTVSDIFFHVISTRTAAADGELRVSVYYELQIPSLSADLMERAGTRELAWRDIQLGQQITGYLSLEQTLLEGYTLDPLLYCDGIRTADNALLSFDINGDEDYGCGTIIIRSNFTETGAYDYDWLFYSNPNYETNYYSKAEYEQNATPAPVTLCPACRGTGKVRQYATNNWWDEGYIADCALCN